VEEQQASQSVKCSEVLISRGQHYCSDARLDKLKQMLISQEQNQSSDETLQ
jgi:hypothetical protein